jgi:L-cysteine/cystine lyase
VLARFAYLNAGTFGPLPQRTAAAMREVEERELAEGRAGRAYFEALIADRAALRVALGGVVGAPPECIALTSSTTEGCNIVLRGLGIEEGDEVVTTDSEHPGLFGGLVTARAELRIAEIRRRPAAEALDAIEAQITSKTRLIALSHVSWHTGAVLPIRELATRGIPLLVDGAQSAGAIPVDVRELGCDFYTVSGQKWLLGPAATGGLYVREDRLDDCRVAAPSYVSWQHPEYELVEGAPRYEGFIASASSVAGLLASIAFADETGGERFAYARAMTERCRELLAERGEEVVTAPEQGTLVSWRADDPAELVARLGEQDVVVRDLPGTGWVRASCGFWTSEDDLERLVQGVAAA